MATYLAIVMRHLKRIKVVHRLPGRLRLYIPLLEGLSPDWYRYQSDLVEIIKLKEGLVDIQLSTTTGRVLICYDPLQTNQAQILEWFKVLARMLYAGYVDAPFVSKQQIVPFLQKMRSQSCDLLQRNSHVREVA